MANAMPDFRGMANALFFSHLKKDPAGHVLVVLSGEPGSRIRIMGQNFEK